MVIAVAAVATTASPATASRYCNEGTVKPSDVSGIPRDLAQATGLQALNALSQVLGSLNQLDGRVPLNEVCQKIGR